MMQALHPTYTLRITIKDQDRPAMAGGLGIGISGGGGASSGRKYFKDGVTGCDAVLKEVQEALYKAGIVAEVTFQEFRHT
jgi:hypothetical protein